MKKANDLAQRLFGVPYESLDEPTQKVARHVAGRTHIARNTAAKPEGKPRVGERAADAVARFGGSWAFITLFGATLLAWVALNTFLVASRGKTFDPYPFILLNLFLSMLAAVQAPIILMSQNRQAEKDRLNAEHDYEVNLKAELEIMLLHEKVDRLREGQWTQLLALQEQQLALLTTLINREAGAA